MDIAKEIDNLIETHIKLWHSTSPARLDKDLSDKRRVELYMETRRLNKVRAIIRDKINLHFDSGYPDPKINYTEEG